MFKFRKKDNTNVDTTTTPSSEKKSWFTRLRGGLSRTRQSMTDSLATLVLGKKTIDAALFETLETILLRADVGMETTQKILNNLTQQVERKTLNDPAGLIDALKQQLLDILIPCSQPLTLEAHKPFVLLMVGVNGAGKTTSIAKISHYFQQQGKHVMLAAGDTFRAAAVEQLTVWGERNNVPVIAQHSGADSASVIYDAMQSARAKDIDLLVADTAGRLHTQHHLMEELKKVKRVIQKIDETAAHEIMLVVDAGMGQNALQQAREFHDAMGLTGITLTKLDGTAKGGIVFAIADTLQLPIRFIGVGEQVDDLRPFEAQAFVDALFQETEHE